MGAGQRRPKGPFKTATVEWKIRVRERLKELGWTRARLAEESGATPEAITQLLEPEVRPPRKTSSTRYMPAIHKALGWPPPLDEGKPNGDALMDRLRAAWSDLSDTEREVIAMIADKHKKH